MKNLIASIIIATLLLPGCKKEIILSPAEQTAVELQEVIAKNDIKRVFPWRPADYIFDPERGLTWQFSNGFYIIYEYGQPNVRFNLLFLESYEIRNATLSDSTKSLILMLKFK